MSYLVLHMDKFKKEAIRGIQIHNQRERKSHSNPDINYEKSRQNYDLHNNGQIKFCQAINNRLDGLNLKRAPRHDAVLMCGLIVSSDSLFFQNLDKGKQELFFKSAKEWLEKFVGPENVIAANVHLDEKTPHLHFCHVPVTNDGRLCAKDIYTKNRLKKMQSELPKYLQSLGFQIERGVIQEPGAAKIHLKTSEFKQNQEALVKASQAAVEAQLKKTEAAALKKIQDLNQKHLLELQRQSEVHQKELDKLNLRLSVVSNLPASKDKTVAYVLNELEKVSSELGRLREVEKKWNQQQHEAKFLEKIKEEKEARLAAQTQAQSVPAIEKPRSDPPHRPFQPQKKPDQGWSR